MTYKYDEQLRSTAGKRFTTVYGNDDQYLGCVVGRGAEGYEAFEQRSLGLYPTAHAAAAAVRKVRS